MYCKPLTLKEEIQLLINDEAEMTVREISELLSRPRPSVRRALLQMERAGRAGRIKEDNISVWMRPGFVEQAAASAK
tara:strand:+ start:1899 stop:2129 length:231 start_codon:yes stop_codon:yes gene_type:complete